VRCAGRTTASDASASLIPGGVKLDARNVPVKFSSILGKVDPVAAALQSKRRLPKEPIRAFPGKSTAGGAAGAPDAKEASEKDAASRALSGGLAAEAKASMNEVQLLLDLLGPEYTPDAELLELVRLSAAASPSETPGFLRIDQSKLPLEMFDDEVSPRWCMLDFMLDFLCGSLRMFRRPALTCA
jgi:hypothetical protein